MGGAAVWPAQLSRELSSGVAPSLPGTASARGVPAAGAAGDAAIPEAALVRDLLFVFQGIDGRHIRFQREAAAFLLDGEADVPRPTRDLCSRLAELGWLYRCVAAFADRRAQDASAGTMVLAFCDSLRAEMTAYFRELAALESLGADPAQSAPAGLTLQRLQLWSHEPLMRLRTLVLLTDVAGTLKGGALVSALYSCLQHGDPAVRVVVERVLHAVVKPLYAMVRRWVRAGELDDRFEEFFVSVSGNVDLNSYWRSRYSMRASMLPALVPPQLAQRILVIGKTIDFVRHACRDVAPAVDPALIKLPATDEEGARALVSGDGGLLFEALDVVYRTTSTRLLDLMCNKYRLRAHFDMLRKFLLLGLGDFVRHLLDGLAGELDQRAELLRLHVVNSAHESAIRSSSAQSEDSELLERVDVRLLPASPGEVGWDVFSLHYRVDTPVNAVLTPECMEKYLVLFNFLWRWKRVEHVLSVRWFQLIRFRRSLARHRELHGLLHHSSVVLASLLHFVNEFQHYIVSEVCDGVIVWCVIVCDSVVCDGV
jgi:gamma-tubulin complex component 3